MTGTDYHPSQEPPVYPIFPVTIMVGNQRVSTIVVTAVGYLLLAGHCGPSYGAVKAPMEFLRLQGDDPRLDQPPALQLTIQVVQQALLTVMKTRLFTGAYGDLNHP